ncbi:hypothetical protein Mapa_017718 [Marchantia paleacea]|nr:hypothetical protein Mapa_017718 [Marchantia paleacea]
MRNARLSPRTIRSLRSPASEYERRQTPPESGPGVGIMRSIEPSSTFFHFPYLSAGYGLLWHVTQSSIFFGDMIRVLFHEASRLGKAGFHSPTGHNQSRHKNPDSCRAFT